MTTPPPNVSNDAIIHAVLTYKACAGESDTLESTAKQVLAQQNATIQGTGISRRYGDLAQVAIAYVQQGNQGEAIVTYHLNNGQVTGSNASGQQILTALAAKCG